MQVGNKHAAVETPPKKVANPINGLKASDAGQIQLSGYLITTSNWIFMVVSMGCVIKSILKKHF